MARKLTLLEIKEKIKDIENDSYTLISEGNISTSSLVELKHNCGNVEKITLGLFLYSGKGRCKKCTVHSHNNRRPKIVSTGCKLQDSMLIHPQGNEYTWLGEFKGLNELTLIKHNICGHEYEVRPRKFREGNSCPSCNKLSKAMSLRVDNYLLKLVENEKDYIWLEEYKGSCNSLHKIKHITCGYEYEVRPSNFQKGNRCPICNTNKIPSKSKPVILIEKILNKLGIEFTTEKTFEGCSYKKSLRFDFCIPLLDGNLLLIEYDGVQHHDDHLKITKSLAFRKSFAETQIRDKIKDDFCNANPNLHLHRIKHNQNIKTQLIKILENYFELTDELLHLLKDL